MANTFKNYVSAAVGTGETTVYTVPSSTTAVIIDKEGDDYKICSPYDDSIGWINKKQVSFTFYQNPKTQKPCN